MDDTCPRILTGNINLLLILFNVLFRFLKYTKEQILPSLRPGQPLVVDNASYHTVVHEDYRAPVKSAKKEVMKEWLEQKGMANISFSLEPCPMVTTKSLVNYTCAH